MAILERPLARKTWIAGMAVLTACFFALLLIVVQPASAHHTPHKLSLDPETATNTVGEEHCVTAKLKEGHGNKDIEGATIRFSVSGANSATGADVTDDKGQATFCYTGTKAGQDMITAHADLDNDGQVDSGEPTAMARKTYLPGPTTAVTVAPATATNTVGEQHCVTATATDRFGNPTPGVKLFFSVAGVNSASGSKTTDTSGQATFCYTGQNVGTDTITVVADVDKDNAGEPLEPRGTATKVYTPRGPSSLTLAPPAATNTVGEEHCVTATATDSTGQRTAGVRIVFSVSGANPTEDPVVRTTDTSGQAEFCYTGKNVGQDLITAFADNDKDGQQDLTEPVATATKTYLPGAPAKVVVTPPAAQNTVGTQHCVKASVSDAFGNPVPNATVFFTVTGANPTSDNKAETDLNGNAIFCYTGEKAGLDTITAVADADGDGEAQVGEPTGSATKLYHPGAPRTVTLSPTAAENTVGEQHCVTATAHDEFGNLVGAGHTILFTVTGANPQGPVSKTTDANGQATFCYTGEKAGLDTIRAFVDENDNETFDVGEPTGVATKTYKPGPPAKITLEPPAAENIAGDEHCVTATVTDEFGNPVPGVSVEFSVSGANSATGAGVTNAEGEARFCYTGTKAGTDTITAKVVGTTLEATATKTYKPGPPAIVEMDPPAAENTAGEEHCVTATVTDKFGNPVGAGVAVFFSATGANPQDEVAKTTDASGQARFCYTGTKAGVDTITAVADANGNNQADAGEPTGVATKTYKPGPPAKLTLSPPAAVNTVGEEHCVTATVTDEFGNPNSGVTVRFSVTGSVTTSGSTATVGASGSDTTDADGEASFCYTSELPGENVIKAYADTNENGTQDPDEPMDVATKTYVLPESTPNCEISIHDGGWILAPSGGKGTFGGNAQVDANGQIVKGSQEYTDHNAGLHVKSTEILAVVCEGNSATIWGTASVTSDTAQFPSGTFPFRVRVTDMGEPGSQPGPDKYGILVGNGYYTGDQPLQGGNVQIH